MLADPNVRFLSGQATQSYFFFRKLDVLIKIFMLLGSLITGITGTASGRFATVANAAIPICTNSVSAGVYLDANADGIHEPNEAFLAGAIQVINSSNLTIDSFQSANGLFTLSDVACDEYTVYHNGDYVGKLMVDEVMGEVLIQLPKTTLTQHIFIPLIN